MNITRRQLALAVGGGAAAGAMAVTPALAQNAQVAPDWDSAAREARLQSAQALLRVEVPMDVEPAFQFRA
jgi:ABC-type Fe3+ transport system permease subunit